MPSSAVFVARPFFSAATRPIEALEWRNTMRNVLGIYSSPKPHWVGDGFPVRSMFSYGTQGQHVSPFILLDYAGPAMAPAHISPCRRMPPSRVPSNAPGRYFAAQFSAGCTTNMSAFDFRQAQPA
jgi:hypothetical protein